MTQTSLFVCIEDLCVYRILLLLLFILNEVLSTLSVDFLCSVQIRLLQNTVILLKTFCRQSLVLHAVDVLHVKGVCVMKALSLLTHSLRLQELVGLLQLATQLPRLGHTLLRNRIHCQIFGFLSVPIASIGHLVLFRGLQGTHTRAWLISHTQRV